jgi:DNA-directed RNA polymerase II subunit RPB2
MTKNKSDLELKQLDWEIINSYFNYYKNYFSISQLNSYNEFISKNIPYIIKTLNPFTMIKKDENNNIKHEVNIYMGTQNGDKIYISKPIVYSKNKNNLSKPLLPNEARLKDVNYASNLSIDIEIEYIDYTKITEKNPKPIKIIKRYNDILIGIIPIMLHSNICILNNQPTNLIREMGDCPYDQGGYFIINGKEKGIISQERISTNKIFIEKSKIEDYSYTSFIRCTSRENVLFPKTLKLHVVNKKNNYVLNNSIIIECPNIITNTKTNALPIVIYFKALGIESDKEILEYIFYDLENTNKKLIDFFRNSLINASHIKTQEDALNYLKQFTKFKTKENVLYILYEDFLPNVNKNFRQKAIFLGTLIHKVISVSLNIQLTTNKDNYLYKRVDLSGFLMTNLFRDIYNKLRNNIRNELDKQYNYGYWKDLGDLQYIINENNLLKIFDKNIMTNLMIKSFKGNWAGNNDPKNEGIVQDVNRLSYLGYLSHIRKVNTPLDRGIKLRQPRALGNAQYGAMCPVESPDGSSIGLIKHYPVLTMFSSTIDIDPIIDCARDLGMIFLDEIDIKSLKNLTKIYFNNHLLGIHFNPFKFSKYMKLLKCNGIINSFVSIVWYTQKQEIHIQSDSGRVLRPVYITTFNELDNLSENDNQLLINKPYNKKLIDNAIKNNNLEWSLFTKSKLNKNYDINYNEFNKTLFKSLITKKTENRVSDDLLNYYDIDLDVDKLIKNSCMIEYLDVEEMNNSMIAMTQKNLNNKLIKYTHCEIDPSTILSVYSNIIPFSNHNPYPRNAFGCQQGKQAIGIYTTNFNNRIDTAGYIIHYPQRAIVHTKYTKYTHNDELPNGENLIVAIATYTGFNQEDSIMVNQNSIERGMFNITKFKSFVNEEEKNYGGDEKLLFNNPIELSNNGINIDIKYANWDYINKDGFPELNRFIDEDDIILGKVNKKTTYVKEQDDIGVLGNKIENIEYFDKSIKGSKSIKGFIDKVFVFEKENELRKVKIRLRKYMKPELGDKMCSRVGQKGVCGMIYKQEDMPFNKDGIVPDIIINPHAIPTRQTIGQLIECVLCKLGCKYATTFDGTTFNNYNSNKLLKELNNSNLNKYSDEILYNGLTGEQMDCHIFFGPTYYYRLKHIVSDKYNYRTEGPVTSMTKQPTKGRSNEGGLRIGEMETNAILGHGMGSFIKESMMERSDKFEFNIENDNGTIAVDKNGMFKSSYRDTNALSFSKLNTPYSFKLLLQEIEGLGLKTKIITDKEDLNEETENMLNYIEEFDENSYVIDEVENDNL